MHLKSYVLIYKFGSHNFRHTTVNKQQKIEKIVKKNQSWQN